MKLTTRELFNFCIFQTTSRCFLKLEFYTKFWVKQAILLASKCSSLLFSSIPVQQNYPHFFKDFQPECALEGLMKVKLSFSLSKSRPFWIEGNHESNNHKTPSFRIYRLTCPLTLKPQNVFIYVFQAYLIIILFKLLSIDFRG